MSFYERIRRGSQIYFEKLYKYRLPFNLSLLFATVVCVFLASRLQLRTDFSELLPDKLPSVRALKKAGERIGGTGLLMVGVEGPDYPSNRKLVEDIAKRIEPLVGTQLRYFEYRYEDVQKYIEKFGLHYLDGDQLQELAQHLEAEIEKKKEGSLGLGLDSSDEKELVGPPVDWKDRMDPNLRNFLNYKDAYLSADDGKVMVLALRPLGSSLGVGKSGQLVEFIRGEIDKLNPKSYHPEIKVNLAGSVVTSIQEFDAIRRDIVDTVLLLIALILTVIFLFFWSFRALGLLILNLAFGVAWTFGITQLGIGYLNTQTAFLGSLVVGTGANYGIILLSRYLENRRRLQGLDPKQAIIEAISSTILPTLIAAGSTAISFLSLLVAENKGLSQFGFIGALGVMLCWIAAFSLLPLWLYQLETFYPERNFTNPIGGWGHRLMYFMGEGLRRYPIPVLVLFLLVSIGGAIPFLHFIKDPIEYDFDNLRNKVAKVSGTAATESRINKVFTSSTTPSIVLLDSLEEAKELCPAVMKISASLPEEQNIIKSCVSIYDLLPKERVGENPEERKKEMEKIHALLQDKLLRFSDDWETLSKFKEHSDSVLPDLAQLPPQLTRRFTELNGKVGLFAFVNPNSERPLNDGRNLLAFTNSLSKIDLPNSGKTVSASGDSFILADLLNGLKKDAPPISIISFVGAALLAVFLAGGPGAGALISFCLLLGTWWMFCIQGWFDIKYNFFNFIALPLTFGIGIDYPVNVFARFREENYRGFGNILSTSGAAVLLCSLTTIIGYYTLIGASNQALVSFAKLAIIGEITCLIAALIVLPAILAYFRAGKSKDMDATDVKAREASV